MLKKSKGYRFYCPSYITRIVESRKTKFLENDLINGSHQFHDTLSKKDHYQGQTSCSSHRLVVIHTCEVEMGIRQLVIENPQTFELIDHVVKEQKKLNNQLSIRLNSKFLMKKQH